MDKVRTSPRRPPRSAAVPARARARDRGSTRVCSRVFLRFDGLEARFSRGETRRSPPNAAVAGDRPPAARAKRARDCARRDPAPRARRERRRRRRPRASDARPSHVVRLVSPARIVAHRRPFPPTLHLRLSLSTARGTSSVASRASSPSSSSRGSMWCVPVASASALRPRGPEPVARVLPRWSPRASGPPAPPRPVHLPEDPAPPATPAPLSPPESRSVR